MNEQHSCTAHYRGRSGAVARRASVEVLAKLLRAAAQKTTARKTTSAGRDQSLLAPAKYVTFCMLVITLQKPATQKASQYEGFKNGCISSV